MEGGISEKAIEVSEKVVNVEPTAEGPRMRIKRPLTEAQLEALRKGREKLAEKRKAEADAAYTVTSPPAEEESETKKEDIPNASGDVLNDTTTAADDEDDNDIYHFTYCSIM